MNYDQYMQQTRKPLRMILDPETGEFVPDEESLAEMNVQGMQQPQTLSALTQPQSTGGQGSDQVNALMQKIASMTQPGYKEKHPDMAYTSRIYNQGVPDIQSRPEFAQLQGLLALQKTQREAGKLAAEAAKAQRDAQMGNGQSEYTKAMEKARADRDIMASMPPAMREAQEVKRLGIKLTPGQRYNLETGEIELIPGGKEYNKQKTEVIEAATGARGIDRVIGNMLDRVAAVEKSPGLSSAVGFWDSATHPIMSGIYAQDKATARAYISNLQEYLQTKGLADLRASGVAPGSITEKEWSKFAAMVGNIDTTMDEKSFQKELNNLKQYAENARAEAATKESALKKQYGPMWDKYAAAGEPPIGQPAEHKSDWIARAKAKNPGMSGAAIEAEYMKKFGR